MPVLIKRTSGIIEPVPYFKFPAGEVHIRDLDVSDITQIIFNWRGDHTDLFESIHRDQIYALLAQLVEAVVLETTQSQFESAVRYQTWKCMSSGDDS